MITPDQVNGLFELIAAICIANHCRVLYAHKCVRGVSVISSLFFLSWGFWNLYFYPDLGQVWSFYGGVAVTLTNCLYVAMLFYYRLTERHPDEHALYMGSDTAGGNQ